MNKLDILERRHDGGFFSCCSLRLHYLIEYFNYFNKLPIVYDCKGFYTWYKKDDRKDDEITFDYFKHYNEVRDVKIEYKGDIDYKEHYQYKKFHKLEYEKLKPFIHKYFSPNDEILGIKKKMEEKYQIDYDNTCVLFYRGNDKATETLLPSFEEYKDQIKIILEKQKDNKKFKFLIQSDETDFINEMKELYPNHIIFNDEIRHIPRTSSSVDIIFKDKNYEFSKLYLSIMLIMSKCKYIISGCGNNPLWIYFFRGNLNNFHIISDIDF
jgi:hypothetical protein